MDDFEKEILSFDNLFDIAIKCSKGVRWKPTVAHYLLNILDETDKLYTEIASDTYVERPQKQFKIYEPKERDVLAVSFRDRIYQRCLNDFVIYPKMTKNLIRDNCASQKGKGTDFALESLKYQLRSFYNRNKTNDGYMIHIDIKKYYPSIDHKVSLDFFKRNLSEDIYSRVEKILSCYPGDIGYFAGSQLVQILGIALLNSVDHFIKEKLKVKEYIRYMDDLILIVKENPQSYIDQIEIELNNLKFNLNKKKTAYYSLYKGCVFLGYNFSLGDTGRVYMALSKENIKRRKRKIRKRIQHQTEEELDDSFFSWYNGHAKKAINKKAIERVIEYKEKYKGGYCQLPQTIKVCSL